MVRLKELVAYANRHLNAEAFKDYAPNGLQVEGRPEVQSVVSGVTASRGLLEGAVEAGADLVLVHHGYFWRGEDPCITGMKRQRLALLLRHDISLLGYHLPLDAHPELGNNARLAALLGLATEGPLNTEGIGLYGRLPEPSLASALSHRIEHVLGRAPLHIPGGPEPIETVGWCTGAAQDYIEQAAALGLEAFISGEVCSI